MQLSFFSVFVDSIEVEEAVSGIGWRLYFGDEQSLSDGVRRAGGQEVTLVRLDGEFIQEFIDRAGFNSFGELLFGDVFFESFIDYGVWFGGDGIPAFGFWVAFSEFFAGFFVWVYLNAQDIFGVEEFYEQWEGRLIIGVAGDFQRVFF